MRTKDLSPCPAPSPVTPRHRVRICCTSLFASAALVASLAASAPVGAQTTGGDTERSGSTSVGTDTTLRTSTSGDPAVSVAASDAAGTAGAAQLLEERPRGEDTLVVTVPSTHGPVFLPIHGIDTRTEVQMVARVMSPLRSGAQLLWDGEVGAIEDPYRPLQWGHTHAGVDAAGSTATGAGVTVAVVDSGVSRTHPDLARQVLAGWDFVDGDNDPSDGHGHGTRVAGVIAAHNRSGVGMNGAARDAKILPLRVLGANGTGSSIHTAQAIVWAANNGAQVINLSLGSTTRNAAVTAAIDYAVGRDVVVVAGAGNGGSGALPFWPAAEPKALAVAALAQGGTVASFSTRGSYVDVAAPGVSILTTDPSGGYVYASGTSFAAPHAAALAAAVRERNPSWSQLAVRDAVTRTSIDVAPVGFDSGAGYGSISFPAAQQTGTWNAPAPANARITINGTDLVVSASPVSMLNVTGYVFSSDGVPAVRTTQPTLRLKDAAVRPGPHRWNVAAAGPDALVGTAATATFVVSPPPTPQLTASSSGSDVTLAVIYSPSVQNLIVLRDGGVVRTVTAASTIRLTGQPLGRPSYQVRAASSTGVSLPSTSVAVQTELAAPVVTTTRQGEDLLVAASVVSGASAYEFVRDGQLLVRQRSNRYVDVGKALTVATHTYTVRAVGADGNLGPQGDATIMLNAPPTAQLQQVRSYGNEVTFNVAGTAATHWVIYRNGVIAGTTPARSTVTLAGQPFGHHLWQVRAATASGLSAASEPRRWQNVIDAPRGLVVTRQHLDLIISATAVPGASRYEFVRDGRVLGVTNTPRFTDRGAALQDGAVTYQVRAHPAVVSAQASIGPYSSVSHTVTIPEVAQVTATASGTTVTFTVSGAKDATHLLVVRDDRVTTVVTRRATLTLSSQAAGTYRYQLRAANTSGVSDGPIFLVTTGTNASVTLVSAPTTTTTTSTTSTTVSSTTSTTVTTAVPATTTTTSSVKTPSSTTTTAGLTTTTSAAPTATSNTASTQPTDVP